MQLNVNGKTHEVDVEPEMPLLWAVREVIGLTGTKYGCGIAAGRRVVTIEGLSADSSHPVQKAWVALDVPQCGYCQSGQIMAAVALLRKNPKPSDKDIDEAMTNICRCGTYQRIRAAIHMAAGDGKGGGSIIHMGSETLEGAPIASVDPTVQA